MTNQFTPTGDPMTTWSIVGRSKEMTLPTQKLDYDKPPLDEKRPETGGVVIVHGAGGVIAYYPSNPGVFLDEQGQEVDEETARRVLGSAEVLRQGTARRMEEAKRKAFADIEARHKAELAALDAQATGVEVPSVAPTSTLTPEAVAEAGERTYPKVK
jgi:hypothetical protein